MHELGIMQSTIELVEAQARAHAAQKVHRITLRIGALAGVDADSLRFAFDVVTAGTVAAGASLEIAFVPALAYCKKCAADFSISSGPLLACPQCGDFSGDIRQGRELELSQIEMS